MTTGTKYEATKDLDLRTVAKMLKAEITGAMKSGALPLLAKVSVRSGRANCLDVELWFADGVKLHSDEWADEWVTGGGNRYRLSCWTAEVQATMDAVKAMRSAYNYNNSDPMCDYHDVRFYGQVIENTAQSNADYDRAIREAEERRDAVAEEFVATADRMAELVGVERIGDNNLEVVQRAVLEVRRGTTGNLLKIAANVQHFEAEERKAAAEYERVLTAGNVAECTERNAELRAAMQAARAKARIAWFAMVELARRGIEPYASQAKGEAPAVEEQAADGAELARAVEQAEAEKGRAVEAERAAEARYREALTFYTTAECHRLQAEDDLRAAEKQAELERRRSQDAAHAVNLAMVERQNARNAAERAGAAVEAAYKATLTARTQEQEPAEVAGDSPDVGRAVAYSRRIEALKAAAWLEGVGEGRREAMRAEVAELEARLFDLGLERVPLAGGRFHALERAAWSTLEGIAARHGNGAACCADCGIALRLGVAPGNSVCPKCGEVVRSGIVRVA